MSIHSEVRAFLNGVFETPLDRAGVQLLVGVSGGPDSLCLLHLLKEMYSPSFLIAVHLNHQLRQAATAEADAVANIARDWGITAVMGEADVDALSQRLGLSVEEAGRAARYQLFAQVAAEHHVSYAAVGHHADDQVETVLMRLLRGAGLAGLRAMRPVSPMPTAPAVTLLRPLLAISRIEIVAYCRKHQLPFVDDASNQDVEFFRNRIRHKLVPELVRFSPQIKTHMRQLAAISAADYDFIDDAANNALEALISDQGEGWISLSLQKWISLHLSLKRAVLRRVVASLLPSSREVSFKTVEQARTVIDKGRTGLQSTLPGDLTLLVEADRIIIAADVDALSASAAGPKLRAGSSLHLMIPGSVALDDGWVIEATPEDSPILAKIARNTDPWTAYIAYDKEMLVVRSVGKGDQTQPLGMPGMSVSVKDLMANQKIPAHARSRWPLLVDDDQVAWLPGIRVDERYKVTSDSRRVVRLSCKQRQTPHHHAD